MLFRNQKGVALIMVLLAMALVVMLASGMTRQQSLRVFKAGHYLAQQQGYNIALGAEEFARRILVRDFEEDRENSLMRSEEHTSELQSRPHLVCRLLLEKKKQQQQEYTPTR